MTIPIICIMGPTASGKTGLAIELLQHCAGAVVSVDSALVYRGMDIGTAKPTILLQQQAPHYLLDILEPNVSYSAAAFCYDAIVAIETILQQGKIPLLVGGTMLYFKALQHGLAPLPAADVKIRAELQQEIAQYGLEALYLRLVQLDPVAAQRIDRHDSHRIQRAMEVYYLTGNTMTQHYLNAAINASIAAESNYVFINIALFPQNRQRLHELIAQRFESMLQQNFIAEVIQLRMRGDLNLTFPAMRTVGYRQIWQYLDGEYDYATMVQRSVAATRQLAKRQLTWLRSWPQVKFFDPWQSDLCQVVLTYLRVTGAVV